MSVQTQCPNCGGYKTEITKAEDMLQKVEIDSKERKKELIKEFKAFPFLLGLSAALMIYGIRETPPINSFFVAIGVFLIGFDFIYLIYISIRKTKNIVTGRSFHYYCYICGYQWSWMPGTPRPVVRVRPELIAKGEKIIEENKERMAHHAAEDVLNRRP